MSLEYSSELEENPSEFISEILFEDFLYSKGNQLKEEF